MFKKMNKKLLAVIIGAVVLLAIALIMPNSKDNMLSEKSLDMDMAGSRGSSDGVVAQNYNAMPEEAPQADKSMLNDENGQVERKLEKRLYLEITIENKEEFIKKLKELTEFYQGYWQGFTEINSDYNPTISVNIKIPVEQLDHFTSELKEGIDFINSERLTVNDVTLEYIDLQSRLENAKKEEGQYLEVLDQANKVEDILEVTKYLNQVRERIEVMQGQMNYLLNRTDFTVVNIEARILEQGEKTVDEWSLKQTWKDAVNDLIRNSKRFVENSVYFMVTNVFEIIFWLMLILVVYVIYRKKFKK